MVGVETGSLRPKSFSQRKFAESVFSQKGEQ